MDADYIIEKRADYIYIKLVANEASLERFRKVFHDAAKACKEHNCYNILGESIATVPMSITHNAQLKQVFSDNGYTPRHHIAWVSHDKEVLETAKFATMFLTKHGVATAQAFKNTDDALQWLRSRQPEEK